MVLYHINGKATAIDSIQLDDLLAERIISRLVGGKRVLDGLRPLSPVALQKLRDHLQLQMSSHSTAIEGNSLTLRETHLVINEGLTVKNKPLKDHIEVKNHHHALDFLYELVSKADVKLSATLIRQIHGIVVQHDRLAEAGCYRSSGVFISGSDHVPPVALDVPDQINQLISDVEHLRCNAHPLVTATILHHRLSHIHPFTDGNGRIARILMNLILMRAGYPIAIIRKADRQAYYRALHAADQGRLSLLATQIARAVLHSLDLYLRTFSRPLGSERLITLAEASTLSDYSAKYLNLLARKGLLEATKHGRNWMTTVEAITRYQANRLRKRRTDQ